MKLDIIGEVVFDFVSSGLIPLRIMSKDINLIARGRNFQYVAILSRENKDEIISLFPVSLDLNSGREKMNVTIKIKKIEEIKKGKMLLPYYKLYLTGKIKWRSKR